MVIHSATREELEELGAITRVLMAKFRRGEQQTAEDKKFHYTIYRLSHNQVMSVSYTHLHILLRLNPEARCYGRMDTGNYILL